MNKLKDTLNNLFDEIRKLEAEGNIAEASELTDAFLAKSGESSKWVYQCNKTGSNIDYDIACKILYLTEGESYDGLSDNGLRMFTQIFLTGTQGRKSPKEALKIIEDWTLEGPRVAVLLGNLWETGIAVGKVSLQKAVYQYYLASFQYDGDDGYNYARLLYDGSFKRNYREAFRVVSGEKQPLTVDCLNLLGRMFIEGKAIGYNPTLAYRCSRLSAMNMYSYALVNYGLLTFFGIGCKANKQKALNLLKIADFAGSDNAAELTMKLESGEVSKFSPDLLERIPSNFSKHLKSLTKRAKAGDVKAMTQLGDIYYSPIVFNCMCEDKAIYWYLQAANAGSLYAAAFLKELWIHQGNNIYLSKESEECLNKGLFDRTSEIAAKVMSTDLVDISIDFDEDINESPRLPFCPVEAMYWAIAVKDEPNEKLADDWRGWLQWLNDEGVSLSKAINKLQPEYEYEFTDYDKL